MNEYQRRTEKKVIIIIWEFAIMNYTIVFVFYCSKKHNSVKQGVQTQGKKTHIGDFYICISHYQLLTIHDSIEYFRICVHIVKEPYFALQENI